ncbi:hypothetical protein Rhopal_007170-T1 [Rhodotorula paludigena]|uniref:Condensin complex subunit 2 n=1 Tax=Rhodotorula paludigena TaxID=86838 RepID=A0AAV5GND0_9BASI|nr:hypothetical protein Rhopal_007170-T1 [Rhodotorula paludigena]
MAVLAAANRLRDVSNTPGRNVSGVLGAAPLVVESQRYEEWMKIATDNARPLSSFKITSTNTWNLALIDYFHDMSLLRNGDDNSINFQKASCTLDGCVKIWTSRVDSVATETGKLLSGLGEDARADADGEDDDEDGEANEERQEKRARKRAARQAATLADDFSKLRVKQFDLEFTVDPLFKKTSADFDEGGAGGILMNHLGCDGTMKVVFDAGDAKLDCEDEEDEDEEEKARKRQQEEEDNVEIDISKLRARCLPHGLEPLATMSLCPSLSAFRFSADAHLDLGLLNLGNDDDDDVPSFAQRHAHAAGADHPMGEACDDFGGFDDDHLGRDFGGGGFDDDDGGAGGEVDFFADQFSGGDAPAFGGPGAGAGGGAGFGAVEAFDPRRQHDDRDLVMSMDGAVGDDGMFEFFDAKLGKNWAGPEHWKMRRGIAGAKKDDAAPAKREKKEKVAFSLDFTQDPPTSIKELFAAANPKSSITASAKTRARKSTGAGTADDDFTLPNDFHFNSQNLLRLFLKPKTTLKMRRRNVQLNNDGGEADVQFWAQAGQAGQVGESGMGMSDGDFGGMDPAEHDAFQDFGGGGDDDFPPPFDTQWLAGGDDDDTPVFDDDDPDSAANKELDDLAAATQGQLRRVRPETVNYAKRAKRVDVKKLKDSIWRELEEVVIPVKSFPASHNYDPADEPTAAASPSATPTRPSKPSQQRKKEALVPVVSGLRKMYPKDKMDEISTSYMFICLLHLANEKGLRIQTPKPVLDADEGDDDDGLAMRKLVGGLESLRVLKEVA